MYVTRIAASSPGRVEYRLAGGHGCGEQQFAYHTDGRERPLRWAGQGLAAVGIERGSVLDEGQFDRARALMQGCDPQTGEVLVAPKLAIYEDAKVPLAPLVEAIKAKALLSDVPVAKLLGSQRSMTAFTSAARAVAREGRHANRRADHAGQLADAAGLDVAEIWGVAAYQEAVENLTEVVDVTGPDGAPSVEIVPRRKTVGVAGFDLTFTLPKSNSLLLAFADDSTAGAVEDLYATQVGRTFDWIEKATCYQMRGHHGDGKTAQIEAGSGYLGWAMVHRAARPMLGDEVGDPHWHIHVTIANMAQAEDGKWATVAAGGRDLMRHGPVADHVLKAMVRRQLATTFGVRFARLERTGAWEVDQIPDETLLAFSRRGVAIKDALVELGVDNATATAAQTRIAEANSRGAKTDAAASSDDALRAHWQARAEATGHDVAGMVERVLTGTPRPVDAVEVERIRERLLDPEVGLTAHHRRFSRLDALGAVADSLEQGIDSVEQLAVFTDHVLADARFIEQSVLHDRGRDRTIDHEHLAGAGLLTSRDVVDAERAIFARATSEVPVDVAVSEGSARAAIEVTEVGQGFELAAEQSRAVLHVTCSQRPVETILGPPGTGKTTMLRAARAAWESAGYRVQGTATAAVAAQNLQVESGIESRTIASLLLAGDDALEGVDVLVIDEASMTDDRSRAAIYAVAARHGTKLVEVGDHKQLRGVGCGSSFGALHEALGGVELATNRRQIEADERRALEAWRQGSYAAALQSWADRGRLITVETSTEAVSTMVRSWLEETAGAASPHDELEGVLMVAATNERLDRLNAVTQSVREVNGDVTDVHTWNVDDGTTRQVGVGDHVVMRLNDRSRRWHEGPGVLNGYRGVVTAIDLEDESVTVQWRGIGDDGPELKEARLSADYVRRGGLDLGYALTAHRAQGLTVSGSWTRPDGQEQRGTVIGDLVGMDNPGLYVSASRHRGKFLGIAAADQILDGTNADTGLSLEPSVHKALARRAEATAANIDDVPVTATEIRPRPRPDRPQHPEPTGDQHEDERVLVPQTAGGGEGHTELQRAIEAAGGSEPAAEGSTAEVADDWRTQLDAAERSLNRDPTERDDGADEPLPQHTESPSIEEADRDLER